LKIQHSALLLLAGLLAACDAGPPSLTTDAQKASYAVGLDIGRSLLPAKDSIDMAAFRAGMQDILDGKEPALSEDSLNAALQRFADAVRTTMMSSEQKEKLSSNQAAGKLYMQQNADRPGVETTASGVQFETVQAGTGKKVTAADQVTVNYKGTLVDGTEFDSSESHGGPATFPVAGLIPGFTEALQMMSEGGKYKIVIPGGPLAYGDDPNGPGGGDATLVFEVEILKVLPPGTPPPPQ
jgi:FKBP-type peptidyl-prolyl cis-trans isomerase FkpA